jgi:hypothetical protein
VLPLQPFRFDGRLGCPGAKALLDGRDPYLLAYLLKRYFVELPDSLIPGKW